jgi:hypothetical protein
MNSAPVRIQLRRTKGWRMPENTIKVDRSTKWGNPFTPTMVLASQSRAGLKQGEPIEAAGAVEAFRTLMKVKLRREPETTRELLEQLRGRNLACWCKVGEPCHADVLLKLANEAAKS